MNVSLEKRGRATYIVINGTAVKCGSKKAGKELVSILEGSLAAPVSAPGEEASSADLVRALASALEREQKRRDRFAQTRKVHTIPDDWVYGERDTIQGDREREPMFGAPVNGFGLRPVLPPWKTWVLDDDGHNVEVDGQTELQKQIDGSARMVSDKEALELIEATNAGGFDVRLSQCWYRVTNHTQLEEAINTSAFFVRPVPNRLALAFWLRGFLSEVYDLDVGVVLTNDGGVDLGVLVNEAWAGYDERLVFWRVRVNHEYPGHIFDPYYPRSPGIKRHEFQKNYAREGGIILL